MRRPKTSENENVNPFGMNRKAFDYSFLAEPPQFGLRSDVISQDHRMLLDARAGD